MSFRTPTPQLFSFNNPYGTCQLCTGFGATLDYDPELIIPNPARSIGRWCGGSLVQAPLPPGACEAEGLRARPNVSVYTPWEDLPEAFRDAGPARCEAPREELQGRGPLPGLQVKTSATSSTSGSSCGSTRVRRPAGIAEGHASARGSLRPGWWRPIAEVADMPLEDLGPWIHELQLTQMEQQIAETILRELRARVGFLVDVGLGYLSLSRQMRTLSGGEAQRINLANSLGAALVDTLYVLDEPTIGLHPRDTGALLELLQRLRSAGNTVVVVEHDTQAIRSADHVVELGPASGEHGGDSRLRGDSGAASRAGHRDRPVYVGTIPDLCSSTRSGRRRQMSHPEGREAAQSQRRRRRDSVGNAHGRYGRFRIGKVDACSRRALSSC